MNIEPETVKTVVGGALAAYAVKEVAAPVAKEVLTRFLGPSADLYGDKLKQGNQSFLDIVAKAWEKAGEPTDDGAVNPRVLKGVWEDGRFVEDELQTEYFAGLLAAARSEDGKDDRSLPFVNMLKEMSALQVRLHYVCYTTLRSGLRSVKPGNRPLPESYSRITYIDPASLTTAVTGKGMEDGYRDLAHAFYGLLRLGLIGPVSLLPVDPSPKKPVWIEPTFIGGELFLLAHGETDIDPRRFITEPGDAVPDPLVPPCEGAKVVTHKQAPATYQGVEGAANQLIKSMSDGRRQARPGFRR